MYASVVCYLIKLGDAANDKLNGLICWFLCLTKRLYDCLLVKLQLLINFLLAGKSSLKPALSYIIVSIKKWFWFCNVFQVTAKAVVNSRVSSSEKRRSGGDMRSRDLADCDIDTVSYNCIIF